MFDLALFHGAIQILQTSHEIKLLKGNEYFAIEKLTDLSKLKVCFNFVF